MMPSNGSNGDGGMMPDPMTPMMMPLMSDTLATFATPSTGGVARVVTETINPSGMVTAGSGGVSFNTEGQLQVDGKEAVVLVIANSGINALLQAPLMTALLDEDATITYADTPTIRTGTTGIEFADGDFYLNLVDDAGADDDIAVYIGEQAPVVMGYVKDGSAYEFTMVGEPLSRMPTGMTATYSGFAVVGRVGNPTTGTLDMTVDFGTAAITDFEADFSGHGSVTASGIDINPNGDFSGAVTFTAGTNQAPMINIINAGGSGTLYGQLHGTEATGVTGAFHNSGNNILGGFAGSKE